MREQDTPDSQSPKRGLGSSLRRYGIQYQTCDPSTEKATIRSIRIIAGTFRINQPAEGN